MRYFERVTDHNKSMLNKPMDSDIIYYSELKEWFTNNAFRSFSIKYILEDCIYYKVDGKEYGVQANHYMLACKKSDVKAYFSTRTPVKSICIDICPRTLSETYTILTDKEVELDNYLTGYFKYPEFFESINCVYQTSLGQKLQHLSHCIQEEGAVSVNKEWFMDLAERIIYQEYGNFLALKELNAIKPSTKKEILRRLQLAKNYMDDHYLTITEIKEVSGYASMSEYHFFRCFKQVYKRSPYQYLYEKRMQLAKTLLSQKLYTITETADLCSFPDVFTFSKAFKKFFGITPSRTRLR